MENPFANITERVRAFIVGGPDNFDTLAQDLFTLAFEQVAPYRRFCKSRGITPATGDGIPALPASAFRDYEITSLPPDDRPTVFHSSGTTGRIPSQHFHNAESLVTYELSLTTGFAGNCPATPRTLSLTPSPASAPNSSLAHMLQAVQCHPAFTGTVKGDEWHVDIASTKHLLQAAETPITVMGTAFSFVHLCDDIEAISLPAGSCVMETGGYKGRSRKMPMPELHALITRKLGVPQENIIREYGMCELSSQAYGSSTSHFQFPRWARARIVSPEAGREVDIGETGILEVIDLANIRSVPAIRTADLALRYEDGFELLGRAKDAEPRGCSLTAAS